MLTCFYEMTLMAEKECSCISEVIPHSKILCAKLTSLNARFLETTQGSFLIFLDRYLYGDDPGVQYVNIEDSDEYRIATLLDARFKSKMWFYGPGKYDDTVQRLKELVFARSSSHFGLPAPSSTASLEETSEPVRKKSYWMKSLEVFNVQSIVGSSVTLPTVDAKTEAGRQVDNYLSEDAIDPEKDPLLYWQLNSKHYPDLAKVARQYLCAPLSSVSWEREFKVRKRVVTDSRNRLLPDNAEKLIWLFYNQRAVGYSLEKTIEEYEKTQWIAQQQNTDDNN